MRGPVLLTVTPNPSLDLLFEAASLVWDDANRVDEPRRRPGGQGINVARALRALGGDAVAVALLGGDTGRALAQSLAADGLAVEAVPGPGETRTFVAVHESAAARSLLINPRGPSCPASAQEALVEAVRRRVDADRPRWLACCGSVPPGVSADLYARIGAYARARGIRFVPDCDGEALKLAAHGGCDLLVPNRHEAERLLAMAIDGPEEAARAAADLRDRFGTLLAAVTLGEEGAVAASASGVWHVAAQPVASASAVGAGDAFLAGLVLALDGNAAAPDALRAAVAAGTAVLRSTGSALVDARAYSELLNGAVARRMH